MLKAELAKSVETLAPEGNPNDCCWDTTPPRYSPSAQVTDIINVSALNNGLQLAGVAEGVLDKHLADGLLGLAGGGGVGGGGEVDVAIAD